MNKYLILVLGLIVTTVACNDNNKENIDSGNFDRSIMLANYADNLIIPSYNTLLTKVDVLKQNISLITKPESTVEQLLQARESWVELATQWQFCNSYNFGPAGEMGIKKGLNEEIATFPVAETKLINFINANDTAFANFDRDTRGIYAIEYLLYTPGLSNNQILDSIKNNTNRINYLNALVGSVHKNVAEVVSQWSAYRSNFISNNGTDIGSSSSILYNEFLKSYEGLKNFKFGIPLGRRPGQTEPLPQQVEAYYSGISSSLAKQHWLSVKNIWEGMAANAADGPGFKEYLQNVPGGNDLISSTQTQVAAVDAKLNLLPANKLSDAISQQFNVVDDVHNELQKTTRFFKSDMSSLLGIAITYSSGDGD